MPDDREALRREVFLRLAEPAFSSKFTARDEGGSRTVVAALRDDPMSNVLRQAEVAGGAINVAVRLLDGIVVLCLKRAVAGAGPNDLPGRVDPTCSVGTFLGRLLSDSPDGGAVPYTFPDAPVGPLRSRDGALASLAISA